jgi:hypothetical protein
MTNTDSYLLTTKDLKKMVADIPDTTPLCDVDLKHILILLGRVVETAVYQDIENPVASFYTKKLKELRHLLNRRENLDYEIFQVEKQTNSILNEIFTSK